VQPNGLPSVSPEIDNADEIVWALRAVLRGHAAANVAIGRRVGLSTNDLAAMEHLIEGDSDLGPVELGQRLGIQSASATALVDRLEQAGHLERQPHPHDRRRRTLHVTPHALSELGAVLGPLVADLSAISEPLTSNERDAVLGYLQRVAEVLQQHSADD
jgi:DNA-binding MarR family transcriptional regulator